MVELHNSQLDNTYQMAINELADQSPEEQNSISNIRRPLWNETRRKF